MRSHLFFRLSHARAGCSFNLPLRKRCSTDEADDVKNFAGGAESFWFSPLFPTRNNYSPLDGWHGDCHALDGQVC
jgi:hypothetical protein